VRPNVFVLAQHVAAIYSHTYTKVVQPSRNPNQFMAKIIPFRYLFLISGSFCHAHSVQINEQEQAINGVLRRGQQLSVALDPKVVEKSWKEYLGRKAAR